MSPEEPPVRILYIDDDPGLARLVSRSLEARGYVVEHLSDGEAGLARLAAGDIRIVALDHHLQGHTGLDVLPRIRALPNAPPVIYVTGSEDSRVAVAALKAGAVDYVWKDVQGHFRELLAEAVGTALEGERLRREKEAAERETRAAREHAEVLLREVNHRVANSLAIVAAFARMQAGAVSDPSARAALDEMQARIAAIAGVHRRLYTSEDVRFVEIDAYLASLVDELTASLQATAGEGAIALQADPILVPTDKAVSVGVIVTELVTNAVKYAYAPGAGGPIRVEIRREADERVLLCVEDEGVGWTGAGPIRGTGLGTRIVRAMATNLDTSLAYERKPQGTRACLRFRI